MSKYFVVNFPIKIFAKDKKVVDALANIDVYHEKDKRIIFVEFVTLYTVFPKECVFEIGYLKKKFKFLHVEPHVSDSGLYKIKIQYKREEDINKKDEWWDSLRSIVRRMYESSIYISSDMWSSGSMVSALQIISATR